MALTLKSETVVNEWATVVMSGSGNAQFVLDGIQRRLEAAQIPGNCAWEMVEVKGSAINIFLKRQFLRVRISGLGDFQIFIGIRDYGVNLDCCRIMTMRRSLFKRILAVYTLGILGKPGVSKNILKQQDLRAWGTVVHHAVIESVDELLEKLGQDKSKLNRGSKGFLDIW